MRQVPVIVIYISYETIENIKIMQKMIFSSNKMKMKVPKWSDYRNKDLFAD